MIPVEDLEVAVLDRTRTQPRKFSRLRPARVAELLGPRGTPEHAAPLPEDGASGSGASASGMRMRLSWLAAPSSSPRYSIKITSLAAASGRGTSAPAECSSSNVSYSR